MNLERDEQNNIIVRNTDGEEIHPFVTVLAAIEFQQKIIPPRIPELSTQGWDVIMSALKECITNFGNPYKITDTQVQIKDDGVISEIISVEPVEETIVSKTPEMPQVEVNNPPEMVIPANNSTLKKSPGRPPTK